MNLQLSKDRQKEVHYPSMSSSIWEVSKKKIQKKLCTKLDKYTDKPIIGIIRVLCTKRPQYSRPQTAHKLY